MAGWYSWDGLGGRVDNCDLTKINPVMINRTEVLYSYMERALYGEDNYEIFCQYVERHYHSHGHSVIAKECKTGGIEGVMSYSEASARDPIFYRWHRHLEQLMQRWRDLKLPIYTREDFQLSDGIQVEKIETVTDKHEAHTRNELKNILITHTETANIIHSQTSQIRYRRVNHLPFKYVISTKNPNKSKRKVIVRIWLGVLFKDSNGRYNLVILFMPFEVSLPLLVERE